MITKENIIKKYIELNKIAEQNGIVIFGGSKDTNIALCDLKQAFFPNAMLYNRSIDGIGVDTVLLHIGMEDLQLCLENPAEFEKKYRELILQIRENNKKCNIAIINFQNTDSSADIKCLNKKLKYIANSERCTYCDISDGCTRSSAQVKKEISFIYNLGFVRPLQRKHPIYDMAEIFFCYE